MKKDVTPAARISTTSIRAPGMIPAHKREILLPSATGRLVGHVFEPAGAAIRRPAILFIHGLHSDQTGYMARAETVSTTLGAVCLTFDLGGHGKSDGNLSELAPRDHLRDVLTTYSYLVSESDIDGSRLGVCGASYGGYLATLLVSQRAVKRLLLRAPGLYDDDDLDTPIAAGRKSRVPRNARLIFDALARFGGEVLVLESGRDELIPHDVIESYIAACPKATHRVIPGATHALSKPAWNEVFVATITEWFADL